MNLNEVFQNRVSMWVRYSNYEMKENEQGTSYIVPCSDASFTVYDPADISTDLVSDALNAGCDIQDDSNDDAVRHTILGFVRKYGLLGWMVSLPMDRDFHQEEETYLGRNGALLAQKSMKTDTYIQHFLPIGNGDEKEKAASIAYAVGRDSIYEIVFSKGYGEPYMWLAAFLLHLFQHFYSVVNANNPNLTSDELAAMQHNVSTFDNYGIGFQMTSGSRPEMKWNFDSLKTVLETAYCLYISDEASPLRMCKHCHKAYYNTNQRSEFCSGRCKNQWNVYKSREKKNVT